MRDKPTTITELPPSPAEERRSRVIRYSVAMGIRLVCLVLAVVIQDWWRVIPIAGAVILPYVAVVIANNVGRVATVRVARPGALVRQVPDEDAA